MFRPEQNWLPASSFVEPVVPPGVEPDAAPTVCAPINTTWLPYVLGSLQQLAQPTTWDTSDPTLLQTTLDRVQTLLSRVANAEGCMEIRWNDTTCALEESTDNGATWAAIPGWDIAGLADCLEVHLPPRPIVRWNDGTCALEVSLDNGATYAAIPGWDLAGLATCLAPDLPPQTQVRWNPDACAIEVSVDNGHTWATITDWSIHSLQVCLSGTPGNPQGVSTEQQACNIANWLAAQVLQGSLASLATSLGEAATLLNGVTALLGVAAALTGLGDLAIEAAAGLFNAAVAVGETALNTAASSVTLRGDVTCAIYNAISADGLVTSSNFATVLTNVAAITYAVPAIVGLMHDYLSNLGFTGVNALQSEGSLYGGSCPCGGTPTPGGGVVAVFNGTDDFLSSPLSFITSGAAYTVMLWVKCNGVGSGAYAPVLWSLCTDSLVGEMLSTLEPASGQLAWLHGVFTDNAATLRYMQENNLVSIGTWAHVAIVVPSGGPSPAGASVYLNGVAIGGTFGTAFNYNVGLTPPKTGWVGHDGRNNYFYSGKMADLRIYQTALTGTQIAAIAAGGETGYVAEGSPEHWWPFNDGVGLYARDYGSGASTLNWAGSGAHWGAP